jgi:hypothetical protein
MLLYLPTKKKKLHQYCQTQEQGWGSVKYLSVERGSTDKKV